MAATPNSSSTEEAHVTIDLHLVEKYYYYTTATTSY